MDLILFFIYPLIFSLVIIPFSMLAFWSNENKQVKKFIRPLFFLPVCFFCFFLIYLKYVGFTEGCYGDFTNVYHDAHPLMCGYEFAPTYPGWLLVNLIVDSLVLLFFAYKFSKTPQPFNLFFISSAYFAFLSPLFILLLAAVTR